MVPSHISHFAPILEFNTLFMKEHKIKSITFDIIDKRDFQIDEDKNPMNYYEFNKSGLLSRFYYTSIIKTIEKTAPLFFSHPAYLCGFTDQV